jgi:hypothetical protein
MNLLFYFIAAIVLAWLISELTHNRGNLLFNVLIALIATFLVGTFLTPYFRANTIYAAFNWRTFGVTLLGDLFILLAFNIGGGSKRNW